MTSYELVHQLINLVEKFEKESSGKELTIGDFTGYLVTNVQDIDGQTTTPDVRFGKNESKAQEMAYQIDNNIGRLVIYMSRYAKSYIKKALEGTPLQTPEDFTCLAILLTHDDLSKGDLISKNLQEKTSGTEVIRRLIAAGLVKQWDDENDKRGKRIAITEQGKDMLYLIFADMRHVGQMVTGSLTYPEKLALQHLLQKLETFHHKVHEDKSIATKSDLLSFDKTTVNT